VKFVKNILYLTCLGALLYVDHLGYIQHVLELAKIDGFAFKLGSTSIGLYTIVKAIIYLLLLLNLTSLILRFTSTRINTFSEINQSSRTLLIKIVNGAIIFVVGLLYLNALSIDISALAFIGGAIGIGIGLGLQKIAANFISGFIILFEKSIEIGDLVELDQNMQGVVKQIGSRYTLIETFDGQDVQVPNEEFISNRVTNWTFENSRSREKITIGVSYDSDLESAIAIMEQAAKNESLSAKDPEPKCFVIEFADSSINLMLIFWLDDILLGKYPPRSRIMVEIWREFQKQNIKIPFPQRDLHLISTDNANLFKG